MPVLASMIDTNVLIVPSPRWSSEAMFLFVVPQAVRVRNLHLAMREGLPKH